MTPAQWSLAQLASLIGAKLHSTQPDRIVRRMASDSRTMQTEPALFWALTTASGDRVVCPTLHRYYRGEAAALQRFFKVPVPVARGGS